MRSRQPNLIDGFPSATGRLARAVLRLFGWHTVLAALPAPKGIIILYPHTSNWDFPICVLYKLDVGLPASWIGKHSLFRWPLRRLFLRLGGIPIRRDSRSGLVSNVLDEFAKRDWMWLAVTPEGTRKRTSHWKSGFYRIALAGGFPVGLGFIDYPTRTVGIGRYLYMTGDSAQDLARIRAFYADKQGKKPENEGAIQLRE
jgi:1-acyl-sn-glycerol-3-phosphate acyltransferase